MISYAGQPLQPPTIEQIAWARANIDPSRIKDFLPRCWPGRNLQHLWFRPWLPETVELGRLLWPRGATRFAHGYFVVDEISLTAIRTATQLGGVYQTANLVIDDGLYSVTIPLWMLPAHPLAQVDPVGQMYLMTLVDNRYFWWARAANIAVNVGTTTWAQLYASIGTALVETITVDAVPAAYLKPPSVLAAAYEPLPVLLDAVAASCGQRIVRRYNGTVLAQNPVNGSAQLTTNLATFASAGPKRGGGVMALTV